MPSPARLALTLTLLSCLGGCYYAQDPASVAIVPEPPVYCYKTLARVACYPEPQQGVGDFVGTQRPVVVQKATTLEDGSVLVESYSPGDAPPVIPMPVHP